MDTTACEIQPCLEQVTTGYPNFGSERWVPACRLHLEELAGSSQLRAERLGPERTRR